MDTNDFNFIKRLVEAEAKNPDILGYLKLAVFEQNSSEAEAEQEWKEIMRLYDEYKQEVGK